MEITLGRHVMNVQRNDVFLHMGTYSQDSRCFLFHNNELDVAIMLLERARKMRDDQIADIEMTAELAGAQLLLEPFDDGV